MAIYRKHRGSNTWHWCTNCHLWPDRWVEYEEKAVEGKPEDGESCIICQGFEDEKTCEKM